MIRLPPPHPRNLSVKGETSERCYRTRRGRTDEQWYAIISLYFDGRIKMNGPYPEITNISFLAKLFFKTVISLKHLSDYWTIGLSDYSYGPVWFYGVKCHFQKYFNYIVALSFVAGGNWRTRRKPQTCRKSLKTFIT